jgi:cobalt/nickel transport protein
MKRKNLVLIFICIAIIVGSLIIGSKGSFGGADDKIQENIMELDKNYKPWVKHIWQPPSAEIESFLFAFQAAVGAGFIGYYIGRKKNVQTDNSSSEDK